MSLAEEEAVLARAVALARDVAQHHPDETEGYIWVAGDSKDMAEYALAIMDETVFPEGRLVEGWAYLKGSLFIRTAWAEVAPAAFPGRRLLLNPGLYLEYEEWDLEGVPPAAEEEEEEEAAEARRKALDPLVAFFAQEGENGRILLSDCGFLREGELDLEMV